MKLLSHDQFKIGVVSSIAVITLTTIAVAQSNPAHDTKKTSSISYSATGKTDRQTAKLFKQLMQNNPNVQLSSQISRSRKKLVSSNNVSVEVNYTLKGKTNIKTARKLIRLFKNSKHIEIVANFNPKALSIVNNRRPVNLPPIGYMPFYYYNQYGFQQIYVQKVTQPTIWYKLPSNPSQKISQPPYNMDYTLL